MCGIAGVLRLDQRPVDRDVLERMSRALRHRGPDEHGLVMRPGAGAVPVMGLVSQRLSIVDRAGGHQPIANEDGTVWAVQNGEIYNHEALRAELEREGHRFATRSDTEVIVHAYESWGEQCVERLDGMFAIALWDARGESLMLARDRFGKKPLVYFDDGRQIAFASELQSLTQNPDCPREVDPEAVGQYLAYMAIPAPHTIYRGVQKLRPAHTLVRRLGGRSVERRYWTLRYEPKRTLSDEEAVDRLDVLLRDAVRKRLMGEVPLGALLSGGVDSTAVVATMAQLSSQPVRTFSIGFEARAFDELPYARQVAARFGCEHHEFVVSPSAIDVLPDVVRHFGEPYADSSAIPTWHLSRLTREHVTVALNGDGGDEMCGGYGRHHANRVVARYRRVPAMARAAMHSALGWITPPSSIASHQATLLERSARFSLAARLDLAGRYRLWSGVFSPDLARRLAPRAGQGEPVQEAAASAQPLGAVDQMMSIDAHYYLPTDLLPKMDISSMAHSLELRSPLLDTALAEFMAELPESMKVRGATGKFLLKQVAARLVPSAWLHRRKQGFSVPIGEWFRSDLQSYLRDHLQPSTAAQDGWFVQSVIDQLIDAHVTARADYAHHLWVLLMFELWHRSHRAA